MTIARCPNAQADLDDVAPLLLQLTHSAGEIRNMALSIPTRGSGMADALEEAGARPRDAQWRLANLCRIQWDGDAQRWQLLNLSRTLTCVRNGERVPAARPVPISAGDVLELGSLRFVVMPGEDAAVDGTTCAAASRTAPPEAVTEMPDRQFDLRDLAGSAEDGGARPAFQAALLSDPIFFPGSASAQAGSTIGILSGLLGASQGAETHRVSVEEHEAAATDARGALLDDLYDEFVRVVRDPDQLTGRVGWNDALVFDGEPAPTLDELREQAETYPLLRDILLAREHIDRVIESFEPLGESPLLDIDEPDDVLGLFAPEIARDARPLLPSLTRREHHALSPDSHVRIGPARAVARDHDGRRGDRSDTE